MGNTKTTPNAATPTIDSMQALQGAPLDAMQGFGANWFEMAAEMGREMSTFATARLKLDVEAQNALLHAKGIAEVQKIQTQYLQKAMTDYSSEMAKLLEMMTRTAAAPAKHHATPV